MAPGLAAGSRRSDAYETVPTGFAPGCVLRSSRLVLADAESDTPSRRTSLYRLQRGPSPRAVRAFTSRGLRRSDEQRAASSGPWALQRPDPLPSGSGRAQAQRAGGSRRRGPKALRGPAQRDSVTGASRPCAGPEAWRSAGRGAAIPGTANLARVEARGSSLTCALPAGPSLHRVDREGLALSSVRFPAVGWRL
jgi:hypothetical protein